MNENQQHTNKKQLVIAILAIVIVLALASIITISITNNKDTDNKESMQQCGTPDESTIIKQSEFNKEAETKAEEKETDPAEEKEEDTAEEAEEKETEKEEATAEEKETEPKSETTIKADMSGSLEPVPIPEELRGRSDEESDEEPTYTYDPDFWADQDESSLDGIEWNTGGNGIGGYKGWTWQ